MSSQSEKEFLSAVALEKSSPFKDGKIEMGGENEIQLLIEFYLENKKIEDLEGNDIDPVINAQRFKVNCIVGENGVGKSRLLKQIIDQKHGEHQVLLDDFFLLEENLHVSEKHFTTVNKGVFNNFKSLSNDGLGFNWYMNGVIFFNLLFDNIILKQFWGREINIDNIKFANTEKIWFLPFNSKKYYEAFSIKKDAQKTEEDELRRKENLDKEELDKLLTSMLKKIVGNESCVENEWANKSWEKLYKMYKDYLNAPEKKKGTVLSRIKLVKAFFIDALYACNVEFKDKTTLSSLSAGEKVTLLRFTNIYMSILEKYNNWKNDFLILIDEPDLHLHLDWQRQYIQKLIDVFATLPSDIKLHFIIATHSPFLISDLPTECIVALKKDNAWNTEVLGLKKNSTFWANFVDLIRSGFFFKDQMLMWSFAEVIIKQIAEDERRDILDHKLQKTDKEQKSESLENIKKMIWDDFLRDNLLYFKPY